MILPVFAFGQPVLNKKAEPITKDYPELKEIIQNMWETMYHTNGVGLAAPQINQTIRLFIVDTEPFASNEDDEDDEEFTKEERKQLKEFKQVFINAEIIEENGEDWKFNEGCLSIPRIREDVSRTSFVTVKYLDEQFKQHTETFDGLIARVIQHEYDHIEGKLFTDRISPLRRKLLSGKLNDISKGKIRADYKTKVYVAK